MPNYKKYAKRTFGYFSTLSTIYRKELKGYLGTPFGWVIMACTMLLLGFCLQTTLQVMSKFSGEGVMFHMLDNLIFWFYFVFIFPLITMRSFAEEERLGTLEGLLTAPVTTSQVVLGKYLAAYTFYLLLWTPMLLYPWMGDLANTYTSIRYDIIPSGGLTYLLSDWLGPITILALTGAFFVAVGIFFSSTTRSQIIAGIMGASFMCVFYFMGRITDMWGEFPAASMFHYISFPEQISSFSRGLVDTRPVVFYLSSAIFMLVLTCHMVDYRRWRR